MQKKLMVLAGFLLVGFILMKTATAQSSSPNIVTTAVPFLRISPDARSGGMGDAGITLSPDANATFWDLGKIAFAESPDAIGVTYTPWLADIAQDVYMISLAGYHKIDEDQGFAASIRYFNLGSIQFVDPLGNPLGTGRPKEFGIDIGYSRKISSSLGLGVALRYINSDLASGAVINGVTYKAGSAVATDLSLYGDNRQDGAGLTYGVALTNLGSKIGYTDNADSKDYIPANLGAGIGYTWVFQEENKFTLALDANKLLVPEAPDFLDYNNDTAKFEQDLDDYHSQSVFSSW